MSLASVSFGASDVILWRSHQGMKYLYGASDIITKEWIYKVQIDLPCYIHLELVSAEGIKICAMFIQPHFQKTMSNYV